MHSARLGADASRHPERRASAAADGNLFILSPPLYDRPIDLQALVGSMAANYYSLIFRAVSKLSSNTPIARREIYERARKALAAQTDSKSEHNALERAVRAVEQSPHEIPGASGPTWMLALSILWLPKLWMLDATSMSTYWVLRPWNKELMAGEGGATEPSATIKVDNSFKPSVAAESSEERFLATNINARRLALSIGIAGAIITPFYTGSLGRFIRHPYTPAAVDYEEVMPPMTPEQYICLDRYEDWQATKSLPRLYPELQALQCDKLFEQRHPEKIAHSYPANFEPTAYLARDLLFGSLIPAFFTLVIPRTVLRFWRWLTS